MKIEITEIELLKQNKCFVIHLIKKIKNSFKFADITFSDKITANRELLNMHSNKYAMSFFKGEYNE